MVKCGDNSSLGDLEENREVGCREVGMNFVDDLLDHCYGGSLRTSGQGFETEAGEV